MAQLRTSLSEDATKAVLDARNAVAVDDRHPNSGRVADLLIRIGFRAFLEEDYAELADELRQLCAPQETVLARTIREAVEEEADEPTELDPEDETEGPRGPETFGTKPDE